MRDTFAGTLTGMKLLPAALRRHVCRPAAPDEIAAGILFLTSHESSFVTGISLAVDGGRTFH